ncbi:LYR motif-containing protein 4 isoform X1 [Hyposmocoma kahamanoa]|uniref:LYR motif-containing protein 4 isoform X1 n=1 Tax=Hyposmocoma kahamanoa TaxID=1477025 RepID=UPI000E6D86CA|nr:LYR motif-containing protein 4 isoform X1 [Hyposmocoma kahamanoa]
MSSKTQILSLYKSLMRESQKFANYNFRSYSLRRVRDAFKENKGLTDQKHIKKEIEFAKQSFGVIQRQAAIGDMYKTEKLVIENMR